ncbi:MAG: hypothetical protein JSU00_15595 [Acidobacteria bacterium]|nr:hypothetical protein [Acidobacteriota bacterium]
MRMLLLACQFAIRLASLRAPRALRRPWREEWLTEVGYAYRDLMARGESRRTTAWDLARFSVGAFPDAADLGPLSDFDFRAPLAHPAFPVAAALTLLALLGASTDGLRGCRNAWAGPAGERGEELALVARSSRVMGMEATPSANDYAAWKAVGARIAGFAMEDATLKVTPEFFGVLGATPRTPFAFLGRTIKTVQTLEGPSGRVGVLIRPRTGGRWDRPGRLPTPNGSVAGLHFIGRRMREPLIPPAAGLLLSLAAGLTLAPRRPRAVGYFLVKTALIEGVFAACWAEIACRVPIPPSGGHTAMTGFLLPAALSIGCGAVLWMSLRDHERRCPVCWRRLAKPVRIGSHASTMFESPREEILCLKGHGALVIPERILGGAAPADWIAFDESWQDCFV